MTPPAHTHDAATHRRYPTAATRRYPAARATPPPLRRRQPQASAGEGIGVFFVNTVGCDLGCGMCDFTVQYSAETADTFYHVCVLL